MRISQITVTAALLLACTLGTDDVLAQMDLRDFDDGPAHHLLFTGEEELNWQQTSSLREDLRIAIMEGHPSDSGVFTLRIRIPDGEYISPHWHPNVERVTVLSGMFLLGSGEEMNRQNVERLSPGSYTSMPPEMVHFGIADGETVIQLTSVGPWEINYVNPEDDPRR